MLPGSALLYLLAVRFWVRDLRCLQELGNNPQTVLCSDRSRPRLLTNDIDLPARQPPHFRSALPLFDYQLRSHWALFGAVCMYKVPLMCVIIYAQCQRRHACMHAYMHAYLCAYVYVCVCMYAFTCMHVCMHACVSACLYVNAHIPLHKILCTLMSIRTIHE